MYYDIDTGGELNMKKTYMKPEVAFMKLRIEERLAACNWPGGFTDTDTYKCSGTAWVDSGDTTVQALCRSLVNNAPISGS